MKLIDANKLMEDKTMCRKMKRTIIAMTCVVAMGGLMLYRCRHVRHHLNHHL